MTKKLRRKKEEKKQTPVQDSKPGSKISVVLANLNTNTKPTTIAKQCQGIDSESERIQFINALNEHPNHTQYAPAVALLNTYLKPGLENQALPKLSTIHHLSRFQNIWQVLPDSLNTFLSWENVEHHPILVNVRGQETKDAQTRQALSEIKRQFNPKKYKKK